MQMPFERCQSSVGEVRRRCRLYEAAAADLRCDMTQIISRSAPREERLEPQASRAQSSSWGVLAAAHVSALFRFIAANFFISAEAIEM